LNFLKIIHTNLVLTSAILPGNLSLDWDSKKCLNVIWATHPKCIPSSRQLGMDSHTWAARPETWPSKHAMFHAHVSKPLTHVTPSHPNFTPFRTHPLPSVALCFPHEEN
jgi:hypothetical protein